MPRGPSPPRWPRAAAAGVAAAMIATACGSTAARPAAGPSPTAPAAAPASLAVELRKVDGWAVRGKARPRHVRPAAEAVRDVMAGLYTDGFLAPDRDGAFTGALAHYRGQARRQARKDLEQLTLGRAARQLSAVRPDRAAVRVNVLADRGRPMAALARMNFAATGVGERGVETPIRHGAEYLLKRFDGRWRVVGYRLKRRLVPERVPGIPTKGTLFLLAIGSDARPGTPPARGLADSIHVIGVNLRQRKASVLGIPRDSYAGGRKVNAALRGGPQGMVRAVEGLTGIKMDGYLMAAFEEFRRMVTGIGGVEVTVPYRMADAPSGAYFSPGKKRLQGADALAFSRNRKGVPGGDFGRSFNQGELIVAALRQLRKDVRKDPLTLFRWLVVAAQHLETDLGPTDMLQLLIAGLSVDPSKVRNRVVPGGIGSAGGASVVHLGGGAHAMFRDLARDGILGG